ncbi:hypothetical protein ACFZDJ_24620 [Streptomyces sp. NPDC007896]|uniref:hypothetical protein n=1 Tax=unclassified Streptomyces TaxID=2593676 RepID=UPI0036EFCD61
MTPETTRSGIAVRRTALLLAATVTGGLSLVTPAQAAYGDTEFRSVSINNGKPIVLGTTGTVTVPVSAQIYDDSGGIETIDADLAGTFLEGPVDHNMTCVQTTSTVSTCTGTAILSPAYYYNDSPGPIGLRVSGYAYDGGQYLESTLYPQYEDLPGGDALLLKETKLAAMNATPEPVRKGGTLTFTGRLTRPDWNTTEVDGTKAVVGYSGQPVKLQFKKSGGTSYSTLKTITSGTDGKLKTTVTANTSGTWRWLFAQNSTSSAATSTGDGVTLLKTSKLTVNAGPEPVTKGAKLTVSGRLTRATTDAATTFTGYAGQSVKLQFKKSGSTTYTTIKTVRTNATGYLSTTTTANAAGYWRWSYAGSDTVASVNAAGDGVVLK